MTVQKFSTLRVNNTIHLLYLFLPLKIICTSYFVKGNHIIQIYSGITSGRVLDGELLYTKILEVNLFAFTYRLFHEDFSPIDEAL